ncbi:MAG: SusC/RagA family TonB-linked outer membrane protein [Bacteroidales bacterium]|nr:SusC/RagA family TonB-linked outer membrane protein [Bacteroidales bacterium]
MKLSAILMVVFSLNISATGFGQFTFLAEGKTVREIFDIIEQGSNYRFFYNDEFESASKILDLDIKNNDINQVLDRILASTDYTYKVFDNNLIVISIKEDIRKFSDMQQNVVRGVVTDESGNPLPGVTVFIKGTTRGTTTDLNGNYLLENVGPQSTLTVSFIGYATQEILVGDRAQINISLQQEVTALEEVVVIGYGTQRKEAVTGSVASISGITLRDVPSANITHSLQGRLSGVELAQTSTRPGSTLQIRIRGTRSLTASNDPLIVLDGIPFVGSISEINNNDIRSIDILKDASATAIYGSRGANGVILITTNRGQKGQKAKITYNGRQSINKIFAKYPMMDGPEFIALRAASGRYTNGPDESDNVNTDWQDLFFRDGSQMSHDIGLNGGTTNGNYSFGLGYLKDQGVIPTNAFTRYSLRGSIDQEVGKYFRFGFNSNSNYSLSEGNQIGLYGVLSMSPISDPYNEDGTLKRSVRMPLDDQFTITRDVVEGLQDKWLSQTRGYSTYNSIYGEVKIPWIEGLRYHVNVGLDFMQNNNGSYTAEGIGSNNPTTESTASVSNSHTYHWIIENQLIYDRIIANKHRVNAVALYSAEQSTNFNSGTSAKGIPSPDFQYYSLGQSVGEITTGSGGYSQTGLISYMGRVMYEFSSRYMLTATIRADASSRLAKGHKWHIYPAVSAGWNIKNESFMQSVSAINLLKIRVGYGQTSNQAVAAYSTLGRLSSRDYNFGDATYATGYYVTQLPNENLGWEFSETWNFGLDFAVLNNRLSGTMEYYLTDTKDILLSLGLPRTSGVSSYTANIGETQNKGFEISLNYTILDNANGWTWDAGINLYTNKNKLVALASGQTRDEGNGWFVGHNINAIYDYERIGLWQEGDPYLSILEPGGNVGMIKVKYTGDFTTEGAPTRAISGDDRQIIDVDPDFLGGFNTRVAYKGFDLSLIGSFQSGGILVSTLNGPSSYLNLMTGRRGQIKVDYWTPQNTGAKYPAPSGVLSADNPKYLSTMSYFDGSYLKIRNISLGYDFNQNLIKTPDVKMRLYFTVQNPFVMFSEFNKEMGMDPETNSLGNQNVATGGYNSRILTVGFNSPSTRNYIIGVNLTF